MAAIDNRVRIVSTLGIIVLLMSGCVRSKPERTLPLPEQAFALALAENGDSRALPENQPAPTATATPSAPTLSPSPTVPPPTHTASPSPTPVRLSDTPPPTEEPTLAATPTARHEPTSSAIETAERYAYETMAGDTLYSIALLHGTTVQALLDANGLEDVMALQVGQLLRLPADAQPFVGPRVRTTNYWARRGETLEEIAHRYRTTVEEIQRANPSLTADKALYTGMYLIVPVHTAP